MSKLKIVWSVMVAVILLACVAGAFFDTGESEASAFYAARDAVKTYLPDGTQFDSPLQSRIFHREDGAYNVHGWTVAPRIEWGATVRYMGNHKWETERLGVDGVQVIGD